MDMTIDCFSSLVAFTALSDTMKDNPQGQCLQVNTRLSISHLVFEKCIIFSNRVFPSSSGRQPKAPVSAHIVCGVSWFPTIMN